MPEDKPLYVGKRTRNWRPLVGCVLAVFVIGIGVLYGPRVLNLPVKVSVNGQAYTTEAGTPLMAFLDDTITLDTYRGDLLAVDGSILATGTAGEPIIMLNRHRAKPNALLSAGDKVVVTRGADETEQTVEKFVYNTPKLKRSGSGVLITVTTPGTVGVTLKKVGEISGKLASKTTKTPAQPVSLNQVTAKKVKPKVVALTFDDGPNPGETEALLRVLAKAKVPATFFMVGRNVKRYPELAQQVAKAGHQIAGHGYSHTSLKTLAPPKLESELLQTTKAIETATGQRPLWLRPPYGAANATTYSLLGEHDIKVALWNVDPQDFRRPGAKVIAKRVVKRVRPGSVILLHDGGGTRTQTVKAVKSIIKKLKKKGYTFVTIQQMYDLTQPH
jgi:peptidoglycan/xylan/chitin deacetylase (PgdA/CDA1 family)